MTVVFEEEQKFRHPMLWIGFLAAAGVVVGLQIFQMSVEPEPPSFWQWLALAMSAAMSLVAGVLLFSAKLQTRVDGEGLHTRFYPLETDFRDIGWERMAGWAVDDLAPLRHGGWGVRYSPRSKSYVVSAGKCLAFTLSDGKALFVGTRDPAGMLAALDANKPVWLKARDPMQH